MGRILKTLRTRIDDDELYPSGDGKPMAETEMCWVCLVLLCQRLKQLFARKPSVCVAANLLVYYEEKNSHKVLSPDCFVAFNTKHRGLRDKFKTWDEGSFPSVVFEITSKSTKKEDMVTKFAIYRDVWKVQEYFLFDPTEEYLRPSLHGFSLANGVFQPIDLIEGVLESKILGLTLERERTKLKLLHAKTGRLLLTREEQRAELAEFKAKQAEQRADREEYSRRFTEAELARVRAELQAMKSKLNGK